MDRSIKALGDLIGISLLDKLIKGVLVDYVLSHNQDMRVRLHLLFCLVPITLFPEDIFQFPFGLMRLSSGNGVFIDSHILPSHLTANARDPCKPHMCINQSLQM